MDAHTVSSWRILALVAAGLVWGGPVQAATLYFAHTDAQGSVVAVTDSSRQVVERREYEPYGLPRAPVTDDPGYTGHVHDADSSLVYMQQRYYDPEVGRFLSVDPVGVSPAGGNFNRYWYANNNPYRFVDPTGMYACPKDDTSCVNEKGNEPTSKQRESEGSQRRMSYRTRAGNVVGVVQVAGSGSSGAVNRARSRLSANPLPEGTINERDYPTADGRFDPDGSLGYRNGRPHNGVDIGAPVGTPVVAAGDGMVRALQTAGGYGKLVEIYHGDSIVTRYAHLDSISVADMTRVSAGDQIGTVGVTGNVPRGAQSHLHLEVVVDGQRVNPGDIFSWR